MSSICIKCTKNIPHEPDICPKNYEGSAKGMEATGAARIVSRLFRNEEVKCFVAMLVTDDDSSVRKILEHSYRELIDAGKMMEADWPRYKNGTMGRKNQTTVYYLFCTPSYFSLPIRDTVSEDTRRNRSLKLINQKRTDAV